MQNRRQFLRGAGQVAIGLPVLEGLGSLRRAHAAPGEPPPRCVTLFFGLGVPKAMQQEGFAGPLEPLAPLRNKLAILRNVDMSESGGGAHTGGGLCVFVGQKGVGDRAGGPSIDQVVKGALYPGGVPTPIGTLAVALFFRRNDSSDPIRCWTADGARAALPLESPRKVFDALFGSPLPSPVASGADAAELVRQRVRRSVLDTVIAEYQHFAGDASPLSAASRRRLGEHLERIREIERSVFQQPAGAGMTAGGRRACTTPAAPAPPALPYGQPGGESSAAPLVRWEDFQAAFRMNADLFAMALRCDLTRFGNLLCESSGGHTRWQGVYRTPSHVYTFSDGASQHDAWHRNVLYEMRWNAHFLQAQMAYALAQLDDPAYPDENGKTILDNALVLMSTEVGTNHDQDGVLHAVAGAGGRLRLGRFIDERVSSVDVYNTCLRAVGVQQTMGSRAHHRGPVPGLLA